MAIQDRHPPAGNYPHRLQPQLAEDPCKRERPPVNNQSCPAGPDGRNDRLQKIKKEAVT